MSAVSQISLKPIGLALALISVGRRKPRCVALAIEQHDQNQLALLRRQHAGAFAELVRENQIAIIGLSQAMGLRGADLEDAVAEAFAEVYLALPGYQGRSAVSTWVYRIAIRVIWRYRRNQRQQRRSLELQPSPVQSPSAAELAQTKDVGQVLWNAVSQLEPRQSAAVELYYRQGRSIDEIAERLECPPGTIKTLLHRARAALRKMLDGDMVR